MCTDTDPSICPGFSHADLPYFILKVSSEGPDAVSLSYTTTEQIPTLLVSLSITLTVALGHQGGSIKPMNKPLGRVRHGIIFRQLSTGYITNCTHSRCKKYLWKVISKSIC